MKNIYLVLNDIRSTHNVGSILRTADAAGVKRVYLCGYTPTPTDRFGRKRSDIAKVALGAEDFIEWEYVENITSLLKRLTHEGVKIIAVEQDTASIPYSKCVTGEETALVLGEETKGIKKEVLDLCDAVIEIPMRGKKESLNVSVAAGIILFRLIEDIS